MLLDDFSGVLDVWDEAGDAVARHGPAYTGASERHIERSEQRIFYATYLQRVAQMDEARLVRVTTNPDPDPGPHPEPEPEPNPEPEPDPILALTLTLTLILAA